MNRKIRRTADGQFAQGQSGNPDGARLRRPRELLKPDDLYEIQMKVAGELIPLRSGGSITRFENIVRSLARGDAANRLAAKDFIKQTEIASYSLARNRSQRKRGS